MFMLDNQEFWAMRDKWKCYKYTIEKKIEEANNDSCNCRVLLCFRIGVIKDKIAVTSVKEGIIMRRIIAKSYTHQGFISRQKIYEKF